MTTTSLFQKLPDVFTEVVARIKKVNTNPRYPTYCQTHFTAGDLDQFEQYRDPTNGKNPNPTVDVSNNSWNKEVVGENVEWRKYRNVTTEAIDNTLLYMFQKFKKGIFVKIKDNKLVVFLPFSKHNYVNEWGERMIQPPPFKDMNSFLIHASKVQGFTISASSINQHPSTWYANNCLIRSEFPTGEMDRGVSNLKNMLETLCNERTVPDIELFFNRRDFPLLQKDGNEPYEHIFENEKWPLISHLYDKYIPILSMVTTDSFADVPFPTMEDWARVKNQEDHVFFEPDFRSYNYKFDTPWEDKKEVAVFRGASTGCGVTIETNPRLKLASLSTTYPKFLDAGITKWNCRPRKHISTKYLDIIDPKKMPFGLVKPLTPEEQSHYKYIVNVDGHVSAFRLSLEMSTGSVILLQDSKYRVWFRKYLQPYKHYVPIKEDLSDLIEQIQWCRDNDDKCKEIAYNAKVFYNTYLTKKGILDFVQLLFISIKKKTGHYFYNEYSIPTLLYNDQKKLLGECHSQPVLWSMLTKSTAFDNYGIRYIADKHPLSIEGCTEKMIYKGKDSEIKVYTSSKHTISLKHSVRTHEILNEAFVGIKALNLLLHEIPNFKFTYQFHNNILLTEFIEAITLQEYIKKCTVEDVTSLLMILFLTLSVAQERYGFVHNDLYPWNILVKQYDVPQVITYQFGENVYTVTTTIVPIIIDYDRSHVIVDEKHYGMIHPFSSSRFQDPFCLVVSTLFECVQQNFLPSTLMFIANFLSETTFRPESFKKIDDLKEFLRVNKKFNEIVFGNKCDLELLEPSDFFHYLFESALPTSKFVDIQEVNYPTKVIKKMSFPPPMFYYGILTGKENDTPILTYFKHIEKHIQKNLALLKPNYIHFIYTANEIYDKMIAIRSAFPAFEVHVDSILLQLDTVVTASAQHEHESTILIPLTYQPTFFLAKYEPKTFSVPGKILTILQGYGKPRASTDLVVRNIIRDTLLYENKYTLPDENRFAKKYGIIMRNISPLSILNYNATYNSLVCLSREVYTKDKSIFEKMENPPEHIIQLIDSVLDIIS